MRTRERDGRFASRKSDARSVNSQKRKRSQATTRARAGTEPMRYDVGNVVERSETLAGPAGPHVWEKGKWRGGGTSVRSTKQLLHVCRERT